VDPSNIPSEVMLQWNDENGSWNHRAYWGAANSIGWTPAFQVSSSVPTSGQWVRLEVAASDVSLEGHSVNGIAFTLYGGRATWDDAGKNTPDANTVVWVDDALPQGASEAGANDYFHWVSNNPAPYSGTLAHSSGISSGELDHGFGWAWFPLAIDNGDKLFTYVYLDPTNTPTEVMVAWETTEPSNNWEYRAYWGSNQMVLYGTDGTPSRTNIGVLPP